MTAVKNFTLSAHGGGAMLNYTSDVWDTIRSFWEDSAKIDTSGWINPPLGAKKISTPSLNRLLLEENTGTPAAPVWTVRFDLSIANFLQEGGAFRTLSGRCISLPNDTNLQNWADTLPPSGLYDVHLTVAQGFLPQDYYYIDLRRHSNDIAGAWHHIEARSFSISGNSGQTYKNSVSAVGVWTGWQEYWHSGNSAQVRKGQFGGIYCGDGSGQIGLEGGVNVAYGNYSLNNNGGFNNCAIGNYAMGTSTGVTGNHNTAIGHSALPRLTTGIYNFAGGSYALDQNTTGSNNTAVGRAALGGSLSASFNTALGYYSLNYNSTFDYATGVGAGAQVTGSNQVQLGDSFSTTYAYGAVQNRSDERDKTDIKDTELGLRFIAALRPVSARWDMREDYLPPMPAPLDLEPIAPLDTTQTAPPPDDADEMVVNAHAEQLAARAEVEKGNAEKTAEQSLARAAHAALMDEWREACKLKNIVRDGSKARSRAHQMLIAQEVESVCKAQGVDFGGLQHHERNGGDDVYSLGYEEFIPPLIKAVQELNALATAQQKLIERFAARLEKLEGKSK
jgi:Chaperone of endosialidase